MPTIRGSVRPSSVVKARVDQQNVSIHSVKQSSIVKARVGQQNVSKVLSNASSSPTRIVDLADVNIQLKDEDGMILVWDIPTESFIMTNVIDSDFLSIGSSVFYTNTIDNTLGDVDTGSLQIDGGVGIGKNLTIGSKLSIKSTADNTLGDVDTGALLVNGGAGIAENLTVGRGIQAVDLNITGISTLNNVIINYDAEIGRNLSIGSSLSIKESIFYDSGNFNFPNGVAYFDSSGKLTTGNSTEYPISTSNYILTTLEIAGVETPVWASTIDGGEY